MAAWDQDLSTGQVTLWVSDKSLFGDEPGTYEWVDLRRRIHPEDLEPMEREVERARREQTAYARELRFVLPDGSIRWVFSRGCFVCDEAGEAVRLLGVTIDITDRKRAEETLRAREDQLRLALEAAHMSAWDHDLATDRITLSVSDKSLFGDEPGTYNYAELNQRIHPDDREEYVRARREQAPISREARFVRPDGSIRWVWTQGRFIRNEAGEAVRALGVTLDITDRKRAEDALRSSEQQFRTIFLASRDAIVIVDDEGHYNDANPAASELFGLPIDQLVGHRIDKFTEPELDFAAAWAEFRREGRSSGTFRLVRSDGSVREVEHSSTLDFLPGRHMAILHDVTERIRAELALRRYATRLMSLHEIDRAILAIQPPEKIARVALRHLAKLVPCWRVSVARIDPGAKEGRILTSIGALSRRKAQGTTHPLTAIEPEDLDTLKRGQSIIVDDLDKLTSMSQPLKLLKDAGARSLARLPLLVRGRLIGSINLYSDRRGAYTAENVEMIREAADQVAIALHNVRLYEENRVARERLEVLSRRLIRAQEDERRRIARELHDEIGQALTAVKVNLQSVQNMAGGQDDRVAECIAIADDTLGRVRGMALDLRPSLLDDLGLVAALQWYVERHARRTGLAGRLIADPEKLRAAPEIETACFRVVQEALTNIARHARATRFSVELLQHNGGLELIIRDDGCGFDPAEALSLALGAPAWDLWV